MLFPNHTGITGVVLLYWRFNSIILAMVIVLPQANIRLIKAGLKLVGAMCSCGSDVASVLIVSCSLLLCPADFVVKT